jgi:hypothetical protein
VFRAKTITHAENAWLPVRTTVRTTYSQPVAAPLGFQLGGLRFLKIKNLESKFRGNFWGQHRRRPAWLAQWVVVFHCAATYSDPAAALVGPNNYHLFFCNGFYFILFSHFSKMVGVRVVPIFWPWAP